MFDSLLWRFSLLLEDVSLLLREGDKRGREKEGVGWTWSVLFDDLGDIDVLDVVLYEVARLGN